MKKTAWNLPAILASVILIIASSCATTHNFERTGKDVFLDSSNYQQLNGVYSNVNMTSGFSVYDVFFAYKTIHKKINNDGAVVSVNAVSPKKVEISFLEGNTCVKKSGCGENLKTGISLQTPDTAY